MATTGGTRAGADAGHDAVRELVRAGIEARSWTPGRTAAAARLHRSELRHWLRGERHLRGDKLLRVLAVLGLGVGPATKA